MPQPFWYKEAIFYELHVRAFQDSSGDGMGDFVGLRARLDYLHDLGINAIWLLPFFPSPWKDDGYDIADYMNVHPAYGSLEDFKQFLREARRRQIRVIIELVLNHTSDQHPWFERARRAPPGSPERDFYVWSDSTERFKEARIIFEDFERSNWSWDPVAKAYYWHRFFAHQPDLNYHNPQVLQAILEVLDFWLNLGVDGFRLDAVPYLVEAEGTSSENLAQTHEILKKIRKHVDRHYQHRILLAEANQWPEEAAGYFGQGDECHMAFHFPLMPRLFMALQQEDRFPILDIFAQTPPIPENCQWGLFLRNHDELSLEMVTEEDRLLMYQDFAQDPAARLNLGIRRRLAPLLGNDRRQIELMNWLLFTLPGAPIIYYGDEIGMGDNIYLGDRESVRTPMQWSPDRNAGFSLCHPQRLYLPLIIDHEYHHETVHVEGQTNNPRSLLSWMKRLITLRKQHHAFSRGTIEFLQPRNRKILAYVRSHHDSSILMVVNLSGFTQPVELELGAWRDHAPRDLVGGSEFPVITGNPYLLTLSPYAVLAFQLEARRGDREAAASAPAIIVTENWEEVFFGDRRIQLEQALLRYLHGALWLRQRGRRPISLTIMDILAEHKPGQRLLVISTRFAERGSGLFLIPMACAEISQAGNISPAHLLARLVRENQGSAVSGTLYTPPNVEAFDWDFLQPLLRQKALAGNQGQLRIKPAGTEREVDTREEAGPREIARTAGRSLSNTTLLFGDRFVVKLFRLLEAAPNPEFEIGEYLTERGFPHAPRLLGSILYQAAQEPPMACGVIHQYVPNQGELWDLALESLRAGFKAARPAPYPIPQGLALSPLHGQSEIPGPAREMIGPFLELTRQAGRCVADLHLALAENPERNFVPEPFTPWHQQSLFQRIRTSVLQLLEALRAALPAVPASERKDLQDLLGQEEPLFRLFRSVLKRKLHATRIRCHGNLHLGQILRAGADLVVIDFEGEPARPVFVRRLKQCPLIDVASMMRSFRVAALRESAAALRQSADPALVHELTRSWTYWTTAAFLDAYWSHPGAEILLPDPEHGAQLLRVFLIERAVFEMRADLREDAAWTPGLARQMLELLSSEVQP